MSEITNAQPAWGPPEFPLDGRLALSRKQLLANLPLSIEFLGILDTEPSVGIVHLVPAFTGHFDWANGTQQLPDEKRYPDFVRCCRHFVAAHEQRLCFPLDTVRRPQIKEGFSKGHRAYLVHGLCILSSALVNRGLGIFAIE
ncbi:DUF2235 domain-containing protein [Providencia stuartii]|uniref:DUF2235 domain-containing protein n=1 Tax=Providencia stuartii TaxID=588 RepID=UPI001FF4CEBF|nr:DUF2235 domain-containing protein [Providencia stuartii]MCK1143576.1 DUF2235 domain-containing protein [Providencia stuartii]